MFEEKEKFIINAGQIGVVGGVIWSRQSEAGGFGDLKLIKVSKCLEIGS